MNIDIEASWKQALYNEFKKPYFSFLVNYLKQSKIEGKTIYPQGKHIFNAFALTPLPLVKAVILGQDPYHGYGQAHGLCFSVQKGIPLPPSLRNIYKELESDLNIKTPTHGCLESWAKQGVLMLNTSLTVEAAAPMSHAKIGWETFTDAVIKFVSEQLEGIIFILWGKFAQQKAALIDTIKHTILKAAHPSPFSAHAGFFGCKHFSETNKLLIKQGETPIDWRIPD